MLFKVVPIIYPTLMAAFLLISEVPLELGRWYSF